MGMLERPTAVVVVLSACALLVVGQLYTTIPLVDEISRDLAAGRSLVAGADTAFAISFALGNLLCGPLSDAVGRRRVMAGGLLALTVPTGLVALAPSAEGLLVARTVQGLVAAALPAAALAYVSDTLGAGARERALAAIGAAFLAAAVVGQIWAAALAGIGSWRWAYGAAVPLMLLGAVAVAHIPSVPRPRDRVRLAAALKGLPAISRLRSLRRPYICAAVLLLTLVAMYSGLAHVAPLRYGLDEGELMLVRAIALPGVVLSLLAASLIGRFGAGLVGAAALGIAVTGLALQAGSATIAALVVGSALTVAGVAAAVPCVVLLVATGAPHGSRGAATALYGFWVFVGASGGPLIANALATAGYPTLCVVLSALMAVAAVLLCGADAQRQPLRTRSA